MLIFDLESNGFLNDVTCIHCLVIYDSETDETICYNDQGSCEPIVRGVQRLEDAEVIAGHNIIGYDLPCIHKIYPWFTPTALVVDTLLLSRLYHNNILDIDKKHNWDNMPLQLYGRHSLEAYGHEAGNIKVLSVRHRLARVVTRNAGLLHTRCKRYQKTMRSLPPLPQWVALEHEVAQILTTQELHGWYFDEQAAWKLASSLRKELEDTYQLLRDRHPFVAGSNFTLKSITDVTATSKTVKQHKLKELNPTSRDHISWILQTFHGWTPTQMTPTGKPIIDEVVLKEAASSGITIAEDFLKCLDITKSLGMISKARTHG